jgi:predicted DCC family thiol-disulfide oxidoreductase YuxK
LVNQPAPHYQPANLSTHQFHPVILFDGVCNLCNGFVQFVIARDPEARFRFASLQSNAAGALLNGRIQNGPVPDSVWLVEDGRIYTQSTAALRVARGLGFPWNLSYGFIIVPKPLRDAVYDWVASNRYAWFGKRDVCMVPTPDLRDRFLDD